MLEFIAWPLAFVVVAVFFLLYFQRRIGALIDRTRKVGKGGIETGPVQHEQSATNSEPAVEEAMRDFASPLLREAEESISKELDKRNLGSPGQRDRMLVRYMAGLAIGFAFERVYNSIWGSQIHALKTLNSAGPPGLSVEAIRSIFEHAASQYPQVYANYTFDQWIGFLRSRELVSDSSMGVAITVKGREFLKFIAASGYTDQKHY